MTSAEWSSLKHFTQNEAWGEPAKMVFELISILDDYRGYINKPVTIDCGTQGQHVALSNHYTGNAVDIKISGMHVIDAYMASLRFPFTGHGLYKWGLHLEWISGERGAPKKLWMGIGDLSDQQYIGLTWANLGTYFGNYENAIPD